jgi:hypothetical protein
MEASRRKAIEQDKLKYDLLANCRKTTGYSRDLVQCIEEKKIYEMFDLLDSDHDGLISAIRIDLDWLSKVRLEVMAPLLAQMEDRMITLDFESFCMSMKKLVSLINVQDKRLLLGIDGRKKSCVEDMLNLPFKVVSS